MKAIVALPSTVLALALGVGVGVSTHSPAEGTITPTATTTAKPFRHVLPSTYKSWSAAKDSVRVCREMRAETTRLWVDCLVGHYEAKTEYRLNTQEFTANKARGTFAVSYSRITLPKGGKALTKARKVALGMDPKVYCKTYKMANGALIICSNGTSY
jgi:hypothetical protein